MSCAMHGDYLERIACLSHWFVRLLLLVFLIVCVFDPADRILGWKVPVFVALCIATALGSLSFRTDLRIAPELALCVAIFVLIPVSSIILYFAIDGREPFEGFVLIKGYLLVSLALVLAINRIDLLPQLSAVLTVLALCIIATFILLWFNPGLYGWLKTLADPTGTLILDRRSYAKDIAFLQVYFVTSPMLLIAIAYYFDRAVTVTDVRQKLAYSAVVAIDIAGCLLAASRNNILGSLLLLFLLWPVYTKRPAFYLLCSLMALVVVSLPFANYLLAFFDPLEGSNQIKLTVLRDYARILGHPFTLLFGQGLGAYQTWSVPNPGYTTELTYLEMVRNFGLLGALPMMILLLLPVWNAFIEGIRRERSLAIAWVVYLAVCVLNPNLFSSMGILIYSSLLANVYLRRDRARKTKRELS
jgi:hypothetical protein